MKEHSLVVLTNAVPGQEEEFDRWYSERHLADVTAVPGFVSAQRFKVVDPSAEGAPKQRYMAIYNIRTEDPEALIADLQKLVESGQMEMSPALSMDNMAMTLYEAITPLVLKKTV